VIRRVKGLLGGVGLLDVGHIVRVLVCVISHRWRWIFVRIRIRLSCDFTSITSTTTALILQLRVTYHISVIMQALEGEMNQFHLVLGQLVVLKL
jgi:hypothetical protein